MTNPYPDQISTWKLLRRHRLAYGSLWVLGFLALCALVIPFFLPTHLSSPSDAIFAPPSTKHWFGTDINGIDLFYRVLQGARISLLIGFCGACVSLFIGTTYGLIAGYCGGRIDAWMMRFVDLLYSVPRLLFILVAIGAFDITLKNGIDRARQWASTMEWEWLSNTLDASLPYSRIAILILCLGLIEWLTMARIVRGQVLSLKSQPFVTAARSLGQKPWRIMSKHLLPNLSTTIITYLTLTIPTVILDESFLSFLGLGVEAPAASWGTLLGSGAQVINPIQSRWWLLFFPALTMSITLLAFNFLGDGLRDVLDPREKK